MITILPSATLPTPTRATPPVRPREAGETLLWSATNNQTGTRYLTITTVGSSGPTHEPISIGGQSIAPNPPPENCKAINAQKQIVGSLRYYTHPTDPNIQYGLDPERGELGFLRENGQTRVFHDLLPEKFKEQLGGQPFLDPYDQPGRDDRLLPDHVHGRGLGACWQQFS